MEFWAPQWPPQPQGRATAPAKDPDRGLRRDGIHWPVPHSWHNGERYHQWQDPHRSPLPQEDPRTDRQQPRYASRPGERHQLVSGADYYKSGYPSQLYSRYGSRSWNSPNSPHLSVSVACSFPSSFSFYSCSFSSSSFSTLVHRLSYKPFPLPNWIEVTNNSISLLSVPLWGFLKRL